MSFYTNRAVALTGKARDLTAMRDGYLLAALIEAGEGQGKAVCEAVGVNKSYGSRFRMVLDRRPDLLKSATTLPANIKEGDPAARVIGEQIRDTLSAIRAENKKTETADADEPAADEDGSDDEPNNDAPPITGPLTQDDILRMLSAVREAATGVTFTTKGVALIESVAADLMAYVAA